MLTCFCIFITTGCKKGWRDDKLSLDRTDYNGSELRIDGYYYQEKDGEFYSLYFFYKNGVLQDLGGGYTPSELSELESKIKNGTFDNANDVKYYWGVFQVDGSGIKFEKWYGERPYPAFVRDGYIVNDTTFVITQSYRMKRGKKKVERAKDETYHFKKFSPKPDSTNEFIK